MAQQELEQIASQYKLGGGAGKEEEPRAVHHASVVPEDAHPTLSERSKVGCNSAAPNNRDWGAVIALEKEVRRAQEEEGRDRINRMFE